jgi:hypothetical protein
VITLKGCEVIARQHVIVMFGECGVVGIAGSGKSRVRINDGFTLVDVGPTIRFRAAIQNFSEVEANKIKNKGVKS